MQMNPMSNTNKFVSGFLLGKINEHVPNAIRC